MTRSRFHTLCLTTALLIPALHLTAAETNSVPADLDNRSKAEILRLIQDLATQLKETRSELQQLKAERLAERPKTTPPASAATPTAPTNPVTLVTAPTNAPVGGAAPAPVASAEPAKEQTQAEKDRERVERERAIQSVQQSGVLLPKGKFDVEPSFSYSHTSLNFINVSGFSILPVLVIGDIQSLRVERDVFQTGLAVRYGILPNLQADASIPWQYETDRYVTQSYQNKLLPSPEESSRRDQGIGDVQFGLSYQLLHEHGVVPDLILQSEARAPTGKSQFDIHSSSQLAQGSGVWGDRIGVTAIKTLDPVVLIFNSGYTYNFTRDFVVFNSSTTNFMATTYYPGGSVDFTVAVAIAMNPSFAINLGVLERYTFSTELTKYGLVQGSSLNAAQLRFGFAWAIDRNTVLNFTAAAGLTEDTPGLSVTVSYPLKF